MQSYFLGLDGGGTKTAAVIIDTDGVEIGRGSGGAGNIAQQTDAVLQASVHAAVLEACLGADLPAEAVHFKAACAGMAGYSAVARRRSFETLLRAAVVADSYHLEPDYVTAYWGATCGEAGIIIIAGTGAVAYGCNAQGETDREDGLGYLLGDCGSGFDLGLCALRYTLEQHRVGKTDAVTDAVLTHTRAQTQEEIIEWLYHDFQPARVAGLAPILGMLADAGDPVACGHVALMARRLRDTVARLRSRLQMPPEAPIYTLGGLWNLGAFLCREFVEAQWAGDEVKPQGELSQIGPLSVAAPRYDAAHGAALLAREREKGTGNREK
jgi:N-acetylglucosamine kinase-like BadF-type ATPase